MFILQNEHSVGEFTIVVNKVECECRFAILVGLSVFILLRHGGGKGLRSWCDRFTINISPLAEMIICVAVTSRNIFVTDYRLYVRKRLGDRLLIYRTEIWLKTIKEAVYKSGAADMKHIPLIMTGIGIGAVGVIGCQKIENGLPKRKRRG